MAEADISSGSHSGKRRYFYTDPLAAAWMAKHFGMKVEIPFACDGTGNVQGTKESSDWNHIVRLDVGDFEITRGSRFDRRAYIHPDSLHLLDPQQADFGLDTQSYFCRYHNNAWYQDVTNRYGNYPVKIIQRNGIPFMWPESEEVEQGA